MTGGILQLIANGKKDLYLTNQPEITYFKTIYRRHTNFSKEEKNIFFNIKSDFGKVGKIIIKDHGDLLHRLYLKVDLPSIECKFKNFKIKEIKNFLLNYDYIWNTDKNNNDIFDFTTCQFLIDEIQEKINLWNLENNINDVILQVLINYKNISSFKESFSLDDYDQYLNFIFNDLILFDNYGFIYQLFDAFKQDNNFTMNDELINGDILKNKFISKFELYVTNKNELNDNTYNDDNLLFIYNTENIDYKIFDTINNSLSTTIFDSSIINKYINDDSFLSFDTYKIFKYILNNNNYVLNSQADVEIIKNLILNNQTFGIQKNPKLLKNVYNSLTNDYKFIFYKKLTNNGVDLFDSIEEFTNISLVNTTDVEFEDNWTDDFILNKEIDEPSNISIPYENLINTEVNQFHIDNETIFNDILYRDYFNDYQLWERLDVGDPGNKEIDDFEDLCKSVIDNIFGIGVVPETLQKIYFLNYIPLFTCNDIPISIDRYINLLENLSGDQQSELNNFKNSLENMCNSIINEFINIVCNNDTVLTQNKLSNFRNNVGDISDIIIHCVIKNDVFYEYNNQKLLIVNYIKHKLNDEIDNYNFVFVTSNIITDMKNIINLYFLDKNDIPSHDFYINNNYNISENYLLNTGINNTCEIISSIWYNIYNNFVDNFNNLYNNKLLSVNIFNDDIGIEMHNYLKYIIETFYDDNYFINTFYNIDYWFNYDNLSTIPVHELVDITSILNFLDEKINILLQDLNIFNNNKDLLKLNNLHIPNNLFYDNYNNLMNYITLELETKTISLYNSLTGIQSSPTLYYYHDTHDQPDDIVLIVKDEIESEIFNPENAMDIYNNDDIHNNIINFIDSLLFDLNPYDPINDEHKHNLWNTQKNFLSSLESLTNPYDVDTYNYYLWNIINLKYDNEFNLATWIDDEKNKWNKINSKINSAEKLYNYKNDIATYFNNFQNKENYYLFILNLIKNEISFNYIYDITKNKINNITYLIDINFNENIQFSQQDKEEFIEDQLNILYNNVLQEITNKIDNLNNKIKSFDNELEIPGIIQYLNIISDNINLDNYGDNLNLAWIEYLGHYMIDYIDIKIGGQLIDKHTGEWLHIWHELRNNKFKTDGYNKLIGNIKELNEYNTHTKPNYELLIPLRFWFCNNIGASLPLVALQHTDIEINVKFKKLTDLLIYENIQDLLNIKYDINIQDESIIPDIFKNITIFKKSFMNTNIVGEYIYVEAFERNKLASTKLEYLIEQTQYNGDKIISDKILQTDIPYKILIKYTTQNEEGVFIFETEEAYNNYIQEINRLGLLEELFINVDINFKNIVKELIWGIQFLEDIKYKNYYVYEDQFSDTNNIFSQGKILFNTRDREALKDYKYFNYITPMEHFFSTPVDGIYTYSFALDNLIYQPTGGANFSLLDKVELSFQLNDDSYAGYDQSRLFIYGVSYNILRIFSGMAGLVFFD